MGITTQGITTLSEGLMGYTLRAHRVERCYRYTVTDDAGRILDTRTTARAYRGAVVALSEVSDRATVLSWHGSADSARAAAATLRRRRPEILVSAVTASREQPPGWLPAQHADLPHQR